MPSAVLIVYPAVLIILPSTWWYPSNSTEDPHQSWKYSKSVEGISQHYWWYPSEVTKTLQCTDDTPLSTEHPPHYWTLSTVLHRRSSGWLRRIKKMKDYKPTKPSNERDYWMLCWQVGCRGNLRHSFAKHLPVPQGTEGESERIWLKIRWMKHIFDQYTASELQEKSDRKNIVY